MFITAQKGMELHAIVEAAKALGGSFKLVTLALKTKGDDSTAQGNTKEWGHINKSKSTSEHTKHKPRLNTQKKHPVHLPIKYSTENESTTSNLRKFCSLVFCHSYYISL